MIAKVAHYIEKYQMIKEGDTIIAGVSGGADSVCLLFVLLKLKVQFSFQLAVVHVNHGIRKEAKEDAEYVRKLCKEHQIPFYLIEEDVKAYAVKGGLSEEEAGRKIRYRAFETVLLKESISGEGKIAVAHNSNDRAETMLFNQFRGTGLRGISGIKPVNGNVIRPLLCIQRKEIEEWLCKEGIAYCHDCTNDQDLYTRNRIRHHILPFAEEEICKGAVEHMNKAADYLQEAEEFIKRQSKAARQRCCEVKRDADDNGKVTEIIINLSAFEKEDVYLQGQLLLLCLEEISSGRKDITSTHLAGIQEIIKKDGSKELFLPYGIVVLKEYNRVILRKETGADSKEKIADKREEYLLSKAGMIRIPSLGTVEFSVFPCEKTENIPQKTYTKWFDYDKIEQSVLFRKRKPGDYLTINSQMGRKSLQDYFVNEKIPKSERDLIYVLADASHIMWVPGHRISEYYKVTENTKRILQVKVELNYMQEERSHENG